MTQNILFVNHMTLDTHFRALIATAEKLITYALGEHDPGSAQNGRTSSEM